MPTPEVELRARLRELAKERRPFGYRRLFVLLGREKSRPGVNRVYRLYRKEALSVRKRKSDGVPSARVRRSSSRLNQCPLVAGFRTRPVRLRKEVPCAQHRR
ncbi:hypothetical protein EMEDMD4_740002 [Sinorhizobium medicae]|uniref:Uncharacterized protein n=1 Tax=Sinorhizobium medicae TaxID=110321 RepID=A0A508X562_9HYPH|nr:hypothetical protein EMEDMD4_740002 [Sinorhizobium medicae]